MTLHEVNNAANVIKEHATRRPRSSSGPLSTTSGGEEMQVTVIAAGFERSRGARGVLSGVLSSTETTTSKYLRSSRDDPAPSGLRRSSFDIGGGRRPAGRPSHGGVGRRRVGDRARVGDASSGPRQDGDRGEAPGELGEGDAIFTRVAGLPVAVFTADCPASSEGRRDSRGRTCGLARPGRRGDRALRTAMDEAGSPAKSPPSGRRSAPAASRWARRWPTDFPTKQPPPPGVPQASICSPRPRRTRRARALGRRALHRSRPRSLLASASAHQSPDGSYRLAGVSGFARSTHLRSSP